MLTTETQIYTISELNTKAKLLLESNFPLIWVTGEISNLAQPRSGHIYFSLKDSNAQIRSAMFRNQVSRLTFAPTDGMQVLIQAQVSLYTQRGDYQLIAYNMEPAGEGRLRQKFEQLKQQLQNEGLFAPEHKQALPEFPKHIGVITSPTGAALQDILNVLKRRFPIIPITVYPSQVQGNIAKEQLTDAINMANQQASCDLLILARGGGSLEDLWPFNEELVARAIFNSQIPIISGVGHETDFTIADFVADQRAPTPSAAAELAVPDCADLIAGLSQQHLRLTHLIQRKLQQINLTLTSLTHRLQHPGKKLQSYAQHLDNLEQRLKLAISNSLQHKHSKLNNLSIALETISPLATLNRGYSITTDIAGKPLKSIGDVKAGNKIQTKLQDGQLISTVL